MISLDDILESNDVITTTTTSSNIIKPLTYFDNELENELNEIMQSLIVNKNESLNEPTDLLLSDDDADDDDVEINNLNKDSNQILNENDDESKLNSDEIFSSPTEDSECYFDTIEICQTNSTTLEIETISTEDTLLNQPQQQLEETNHFLESLNDLDKTATNDSSSNNESIQTNNNNSQNQIIIIADNNIEPEISHEPIPQETEIEPNSDNVSQQPSQEIETENIANNTASSEIVIKNEISIEVTDYQTEWNELTESEKTLGLIAPIWMPDSETDVCLKCSNKFSLLNRRHHCRACGLIFCSKCCNLKILLPCHSSGGGAGVSNHQDEDTGNATNSSRNQISRCCISCYEIINKGILLSKLIDSIERL